MKSFLDRRSSLTHGDPGEKTQAEKAVQFRKIKNDINALAIQYGRRCEKQRPNKDLEVAKNYLKSNELVAVPFDKGCGFYIMKKSSYNRKLDNVLSADQFVAEPSSKRKNAKDVIIKEEERINNCLLKLMKAGKISEDFYQKARSVGGQPARLYGLAKVHKKDVPLRPIVSMPGSTYDNLGKVLAHLVGRLPEAQIACDTKRVAARLRKSVLNPGEQLASLDVTSLFTMVPLHETIAKTADLLANSGVIDKICDKGTIESLLLLACENVCILTHNGYYRQKDGVAMGSPLGPFLANIFMSEFDSVIAENADGSIYERYVDDILLSLTPEKLDDVIKVANHLHSNLKFTSEVENESGLSFLDLKLKRQNCKLNVSWYKKATDTNVILNYYSLAPIQYKKALVRGTVHRLFQISSGWENFDLDLTRAKKIFEANQYPPSAYNPLIRDSLNRILDPKVKSEVKKDTAGPSNDLFIQYRGHVSDWFKSKMQSISGVGKLNVIFTTRKLRTLLPSLKTPVPANLKSNVIYRITCPGCSAQYIGQTQRHLQKRCNEHSKVSTPVGKHFQECTGSTERVLNETKILNTCPSQSKLLTLEAIYIAKLKPSLNTREEFRQRHLTLRF